MACAQFPHCHPRSPQSSAPPIMVSSIRSQLRPWEYAGYGAKITAIVDWYDGWWVGTLAESDNAEVPPQIIDKQQWVSGFVEGWKDAENARSWRTAGRAG